MNHPDQGLVGESDLPGIQAVAFQLLGHQVILGNVKLFIFRVAVDLNYLHPVQQRAGNGLSGIGRGDKHHLGKVNGRLYIVVPEFDILLSVQHLQQS